MKLKNIVCLLAAGLFIALFAGSLSAQETKTKTKILKYDAQGRVIGYQESDVDNKAKSKSKDKATGGAKTFNPDTSFEKGELIVINPPRSFASGIRSMGYQVIETVKISGLKMVVQRLRVPPGVSVPKAIKQLRGRFPGVEIDANHQFDPSGKVEFPKKTARALIRWTKAPANCGKGVRIGMIDAGVDVTHPALKGQKVVYKSFHKAGRKEGPKDHGTAVAGIMVGTPEWGGLLPGAELRAANMFEYNEEGRKVGNAIGLLKAANWLINENVHIINLSVAGADNKVLRRIFQKALKQKLVLVAAGGNWGRADKPAYPAAYKGVIAVTAISDQGLIYSKANTGKYIDFAAPGVKVYTAAPGGGGRLQSGTSFATPFITALMGLEIAKGNAKTVSALDALLRKNIKDLGLPGRDDVFGWGFARRKPKC
ncbi:MAG: S8 family serine peptidase [Rhodospirillaceae bacterium]|jgi:subtilisin family serine protease|nr:S8 family serine peptidase [Rhodospirillaceae bacterium]MBT5243730.1 S8 family serine peptidase [Rhodospirillaceae bacterium]MBT5563827.1 S8 family serine peptidase [Rhodospirillaceae bacterium]MBT6241684.1 S8 family serine peptidase [Rhodospirillaceae bacterium]MBT7138174.1 S8 family serine peptidase [Rhodospirillaceae bacterium]